MHVSEIILGDGKVGTGCRGMGDNVQVEEIGGDQEIMSPEYETDHSHGQVILHRGHYWPGDIWKTVGIFLGFLLHLFFSFFGCHCVTSIWRKAK